MTNIKQKMLSLFQAKASTKSQSTITFYAPYEIPFGDHRKNLWEATEPPFKDQPAQIKSLLDRIERITADNETLRYQNRRWFCNNCQTTFYGNISFTPQKITCPRCQKGICSPQNITPSSMEDSKKVA